jgi:hypothetical protein
MSSSTHSFFIPFVAEPALSARRVPLRHFVANSPLCQSDLSPIAQDGAGQCMPTSASHHISHSSTSPGFVHPSLPDTGSARRNSPGPIGTFFGPEKDSLFQTPRLRHANRKDLWSLKLCLATPIDPHFLPLKNIFSSLSTAGLPHPSRNKGARRRGGWPAPCGGLGKDRCRTRTTTDPADALPDSALTTEHLFPPTGGDVLPAAGERVKSRLGSFVSSRRGQERFTVRPAAGQMDLVKSDRPVRCEAH